MARQPVEIDDPSELAGARIDVPARIGWLLRTSRVAAGVSLRDFGRLAGDGRRFSPATLSRVETTGRRSGVVIDAYERVLGLPYGGLRAPIDVLCRTFTYAPPDVEPLEPAPSLAAFSDACEAVDGEPAAADWFRFAELHVGGSFGLPARLVRPAIDRLVSEVVRSAGTAYQVRYEALAKLRCSAYADVVADAVRDAVTAPGMQRPNDLLSAITELPTREALEWSASLLGDPSWQLAHAGCLGIQNLRSVGDLPLDAWTALVPTIVAAAERAAGDRLREPILSSTIACCPPAVRTAVRDRLRAPLAPPRRATRWSRSRVNRHYAYAGHLAAEITDAAQGESMLARLLFELLYDFRATHVTTSAFLLAASPFADRAREVVCAAALEGPDEVTRHGAAVAFAPLMVAFQEADPAPWLASSDPVLQSAGLAICGFAGVGIADDELRRRVREGGEVCRDALFAAGMARQPVLAEISSDPTMPDDVRTAAEWWRREGGLILR